MRDTFYDLSDSCGIIGAIFVVILIVAFLFALSFGFSALCVWVFSKIFGFAFRWLYVLGFWLAIRVLKSIFGSGIKISGD